MKVLVTGGEGQLARAIAETWQGHDVVRLSRARLDLADPASIVAAVASVMPQVIVNAGAFTAVDRCESEPELAAQVNGQAVAVLAQEADRLGALLVQISTDYVFDGQGTRPYREEDPTAPRSVYGKTKLEGEAAAASARAHLIARTSWLYEAWGKNFYRTMLNAAAQGRSLKVVDDQRGTPTSCRALARQMERAVDEAWRGLVHVTCSGETTWHGFAQEVFRQHGLAPELKPCTTAEYPLPAPRPAYSVLDGGRRARLGTDLMPDWRDALAEVVSETKAMEGEKQP